MYTAKEMCNSLQSAPSTLRNYAKVFEEAGHVYQRDERANRVYTDDDYRLLSTLITARQNYPKESTRALVDKIVDTRFVSTSEAESHDRPTFPFPYFNVRFDQLLAENQNLRLQLSKQEKWMIQTQKEVGDMKHILQQLETKLLPKEKGATQKLLDRFMPN
ncbi:hypothetical protein [Planococcus sp. CAU13]|uniref:hypothetical protein n=1 Tax=Planococcus sp. CAU13 TaxID=1541197 RepID=UPI00052FE9FB|nr:hypothetical protein [Planococcus sp. CAU13]